MDLKKQEYKILKSRNLSGFMNLQNKVTIIMAVMLLVVFGSMAILIGEHYQDTLENQMGNNAMDMAITIASLKEVGVTLAYELDYMPLYEKIERIKAKTRFQYIIVMDMDGTQYTYPYEVGLGKAYKNGGEERVLEDGEAYVSADRNVLISAIRAFVPVYYNDEQVGAVLVGLLTDRVHRENEAYLNKIYLAILSGALVGIIGAALLARNIKRSTYGLEPKEIALLLGQREIVLESIKLGILAVDKHYKIIWINKVAISEFGFLSDSLGSDVRDGYPKLGQVLMRVMESETPVYNEELRLHQDLNLMCSHTITRDPDGDISGVVSSFENMTEVKAMAEELIGYKKMTEALRAQSHEFMNKLQTISGLVQLGETDEVLDFISEESNKRIDLTAVLNQNIRKKHVAAILLVKYNQVTEAKYMLNIDSSSNLSSLPDSIHEDELCSVLGNLIDNAQEAFTSGIGDTIDVWISESAEGVDIEVSDNGPGVPESIQAKVFERGVTTKSESRGLGLNIVRDILENAGGSIRMTCDHGTVFKIHIPWE